jgi:hypothetical protein
MTFVAKYRNGNHGQWLAIRPVAHLIPAALKADSAGFPLGWFDDSFFVRRIRAWDQQLN